MKINSRIVYLQNRYPFRIAHGTRTGIDTYILELSDGEFTGYGEAAPVPYYGYSASDLRDLIEANREIIESYNLENAEDFWTFMNPHLGHNHFAQCALDIAAHDLVAKRKGFPLYKTWGLSIENLPYSDYTIGIDEISVMVEKMKEMPFPIYKIKLGTDNDVEIIKALRKETDAIFRVDANCAWDADESIRNSHEFARLGVEFIEQPLPADELDAMSYVLQHTALPLIADESCVVESDVEKCFNRFSGVNIKLAKCGGITPALRMIRQARALGLKVMVGCMTETSIGISAIGHLAPYLDYVDMDGALLIANDPAEGVYLDEGKITFPDRNGTGVILRQTV